MRILRTIQVLALATLVATSAGAQAPAADASPLNRRATEALIQAHQAQGQLADRDREREKLFAYRQALPEGQRASYTAYMRDQFNVGGRNFRVMEYFEPRSPTFTDYEFSLTERDGGGLTRYSVGSYVATADMPTDTGLARKGERVYYMDRYEMQKRSTYRVMKDKPSYEAMKALVIAAVEAANARPVLARTADPSAGLTDITLERTWCYGSCPIDALVLRADGTAIYTGTANTSLQGVFSGSFPKEEFNRLARWLVSEGFLEMKPIYGSPNADTPTEEIRVARGADSKWIINNSIDQSEVLAGMGKVIRGVAAEISWQPVKSGIRAVAMWKRAGLDWQPMSGSLIYIYPPDGKQEMALQTDAQGKLEIPLVPGTYRIEPVTLGRSYPLAWPPELSPYLTTVVVQKDRYFEADFRFDREKEGTEVVRR